MLAASPLFANKAVCKFRLSFISCVAAKMPRQWPTYFLTPSSCVSNRKFLASSPSPAYTEWGATDTHILEQLHYHSSYVRSSLVINYITHHSVSFIIVHLHSSLNLRAHPVLIYPPCFSFGPHTVVSLFELVAATQLFNVDMFIFQDASWWKNRRVEKFFKSFLVLACLRVEMFFAFAKWRINIVSGKDDCIRFFPSKQDGDFLQD